MNSAKISLKQTVPTILVIIVGFAAIFLLSNFVEKSRPSLPEGIEDEDLALHGVKLRGFSLGLEGLIADWYWMQSLQYIGDKVLQSKEDINLENLQPLNPRLLYPMLDTATDLDPHFMAVYSYGAVVLPAINPEQAIKIAEKGIRENPNEWRLYQHLGYIYWRLQNYEKAAAAYSEGAKIAGAPPFLKLMTAQMKNEGGSRETARAIYEQMFREAEDQQTKENAAIHILKLDSMDERDAINAALKTFKEKTNRCANNWAEILPLLKSVKLPNGKDFLIDKSNNLVDPSGVPYVLDKQNCVVHLDFQNSKIPPQ
jgi:tetratricopeptide (TPR) repeat protein